MFSSAKFPKKATNLSRAADVLNMAKELEINISEMVDARLATGVKRRYWEHWRECNREAFDAYNIHIAKHGLPLAKYRTFGKSLGDGRKAT